MTFGSLTLVTYVWHYIVARAVYDQLLRPAIRGHLIGTVLGCVFAAAGFMIGRWSGRGRRPTRRRT